jgi:ribosomal protein L20
MTVKNNLKDALRSVGGREEFERQYQQYSRSLHFIDRDKRELLSKYADNWVAVYNSKVIAHRKRYRDVVKDIKRKGLPIEEVALKFLSTRRVTTLF